MITFCHLISSPGQPFFPLQGQIHLLYHCYKTKQNEYQDPLAKNVYGNEIPNPTKIEGNT